MKHGRRYPPDMERRVRVEIELARRGMAVSGLARAIGISETYLYSIIGGVRRPKNIEERIAAYFGMVREDLLKEEEKS
jgi:hypothetical protein